MFGVIEGTFVLVASEGLGHVGADHEGLVGSGTFEDFDHPGQGRCCRVDGRVQGLSQRERGLLDSFDQARGPVQEADRLAQMSARGGHLLPIFSGQQEGLWVFEVSGSQNHDAVTVGITAGVDGFTGSYLFEEGVGEVWSGVALDEAMGPAQGGQDGHREGYAPGLPGFAVTFAVELAADMPNPPNGVRGVEGRVTVLGG